MKGLAGHPRSEVAMKQNKSMVLQMLICGIMVDFLNGRVLYGRLACDGNESVVLQSLLDRLRIRQTQLQHFDFKKTDKGQKYNASPVIPHWSPK